MKTDPDFYSTLQKIAAIQAERRANWLTGQPKSKDLEAAHQLELVALRNQLPALRVQESESPPTSPANINPYRGGVRRLVGKLFKRFFVLPSI
jgi:hypothetical protein